MNDAHTHDKDSTIVKLTPCLCSDTCSSSPMQLDEHIAALFVHVLDGGHLLTKTYILLHCYEAPDYIVVLGKLYSYLS